jgi:hypothetical protein
VHEAHLLGQLAMKLGRAVTFSHCSTFPTLDSPLTNLLWHVMKTVFGNAPGPGRLAPLWVGWAWALCHIIPSCHIVREHPWFTMCMDFGPYSTFPSSDVPVMADQQNSWSLLVISTYLLYLECNIGMLVVNICIL